MVHLNLSIIVRLSQVLYVIEHRCEPRYSGNWSTNDGRTICRFAPGKSSLGRPASSHLLCFSRAGEVDGAAGIADVLPQTGDVTWTRGMGLDACRAACQFILSNTTSHTVVDPFCASE
jgi:hypothetical protein